MKREDAFVRAEVAMRTGVPVSPRTYREIRDALGDLTPEEESILASHRKVREHEDANAKEQRVVLAAAGERLLAAWEES